NWRWRLGLMMLASGVGRLRDLTDYAAYGGAPILGFENIVIKSHGRSTAKAIANAVKVAAKAARDGVPREIAEGVAQLSCRDFAGARPRLRRPNPLPWSFAGTSIRPT